MVETVSSSLEQSQVVPPTNKTTQYRSVSAESSGADSWVVLNNSQEDKETLQTVENEIPPMVTAENDPTAVVKENVSPQDGKSAGAIESNYNNVEVQNAITDGDKHKKQETKPRSLLEGWEELIDPDSGLPYYLHT
eukprot:5243799-Ditylum_brightwellii.AAC.1